MNFIDLWQLSTRMFRARKSRTILTILGLGIGLGTIFVLVSFGFGIRNVILDLMTSTASLSSIDVSRDEDKIEKISLKDVELISSFKEVDKISSLISFDGQSKIFDKITDCKIFLVDANYLEISGKKIISGNFLNDENKNGVVITEGFTKILGKDANQLIDLGIDEIILRMPEDEIGQKFKEDKLKNDYKVVGVVADKNLSIYINSSSALENQTRFISLLKVKVHEVGQVKELTERLHLLGYSTSSISKIVNQTSRFFSVANVVLALFGIISLAVSAIGMFNTMVVSLLEKTEEIGIMKSIGATDRHILLIFIFESTVIGFLGGITALAMGSLIQFIINSLINFLAINLGGQAYQLFHSPGWFVIVLLLSSGVVGFLTGYIPAKRASKIDPLDALKYR